MVIYLMASQKIKKTSKTTYRKSKSKPKHCPTCGAFVSKRGRKK